MKNRPKKKPKQYPKKNTEYVMEFLRLTKRQKRKAVETGKFIIDPLHKTFNLGQAIPKTNRPSIKKTTP